MSSEKVLCEFCDQEWLDQSVLQEHVNKRHLTDKCKYCEELFPGSDSLSLHLDKEHNLDFVSETLLDKNVVEAMEVNEVEILENVEGSDVNDDFLKQKVKEILQKEESRSFLCKLCQIGLPSKSSYDQHWEQIHGF